METRLHTRNVSNMNRVKEAFFVSTLSLIIVLSKTKTESSVLNSSYKSKCQLGQSYIT